MPTHTAIWFAILQCCPAPAGPWSEMFPPSSESTGRARSNAAASPPAMMTSRASRAPTSPPETGASMASSPRADAAAEILRARTGLDVVMSTRSAPGRALSMIPPGARYVCSTSCGKPSMVMTTAASAAAAPAESRHCAPDSRRGSALALVRLKTRTGWPAARRWPAMLRPMTPVPMKAIPGFPGPGSLNAPICPSSPGSAAGASGT